MRKDEAAIHAKYLKAIADDAVAISRKFNEDMGKRFGKYRNKVVYFPSRNKRVYFTIEQCVYSPELGTYLYDIVAINPPANVPTRQTVKEEELKVYPYYKTTTK